MTIQLEDRAAALVACVIFVGGAVVGWKLKEYRLKYLKAKRDFYLRKAGDTHDRIHNT